MSGTFPVAPLIARIVSAVRRRPRDEAVDLPPMGSAYVVVDAAHRAELRLDVLITAIHQLATEGRDATLFVAGAHTEYTRSLIALCRGLGIADRVRFVGELSSGGIQRLCTGALASSKAPQADWGRTASVCADRLRSLVTDPGVRARAIAARARVEPGEVNTRTATLATAQALTSVASLAVAADRAMGRRRA
jgi:glycosyltransferase involved in cell wall biosynthesis